jgi:hypothetical protein
VLAPATSVAPLDDEVPALVMAEITQALKKRPEYGIA